MATEKNNTSEFEKQEMAGPGIGLRIAQELFALARLSREDGPHEG